MGGLNRAKWATKRRFGGGGGKLAGGFKNMAARSGLRSIICNLRNVCREQAEIAWPKACRPAGWPLSWT